MDIFFALIIKLLPLYAIMAGGFFLARNNTIGLGQAISYVQINLIAPVVIATSVATLNMKGEYILLPVIFTVLCCAIALLLFRIGGHIWNDSTRNLIAYSGGSANTGYFGLPVALILFPENAIGLFMLTMLGFQIYENTLGYYLIARGHYTVSDSLKRLLRLPTLYGCIAGIALSVAHIGLPEIVLAMGRDFRSTYIILGALMIGVGLAQAASFKPDGKFLAVSLGAKFILWPLLVYALILLDEHVTHLFTPLIHQMMLLLAIVPLPANAVAFAMLLNVQPQKAAMAVFISTVIALLYIPAVLMLLGYI